MLTALRQLTALYLGLFMINIHHMSMASLINYFGDEHGMSKSVLGLITSATYLGFFLGCYLLMPLLRRVSYIRAFAASSSAAAICALLISLVIDPYLWLALRLLSGAAIGICQAIGESWLAEVAEKETKGLLYGIYSVVVYFGLAASQLLLYFGDRGINVSMALAVIAALLALLPICLTKFGEPTLNVESRMMSAKECFRVSRLSCMGIILVGSCISSSSLVVLYGRGLGMETGLIVILSTTMFLSSMVFHLPVGLISDRLANRRQALLGVCVLAVPLAFLIAAFGSHAPFPVLLAMVFLFAGLMPTIYPMCMALGTDLVSKENLTPFVSRAFQLYFIGGISGPLATGALMQVFSESWFFVVQGLLLSALLVLCASSQFMPQLRPLRSGTYFDSAALTGPGSGTSEPVQQTLEKEDYFVGPPEPPEGGEAAQAFPAAREEPAPEAQFVGPPQPSEEDEAAAEFGGHGEGPVLPKGRAG